MSGNRFNLEVIFFIVSCSLILASTSFAANSVDISIKIKHDDLRVINRDVFGVHGELLWSSVRYEDPLLAEYYQDLGFTSIRLPGGTTANYYLSKTGSFGCKRKIPESSKSADRIKKFSRALTKKNRSYSTEDFISFLKRNNTDVSLVANVLCDTPDSTSQWLQKFKNAGVEINAVEMGNELYYPESEWAFPEPMDYIKTAYSHGQKVKEIYPDAKIGLIASSFSFKSTMFPDVAKMRTYKRLKRGIGFEEASAKVPFGDAFVIHLYSKLGMSKLDEMSNTVDNNKAYINAISHFDTRLSMSLNYLQGLSVNKKIWVTEWGISFYGWLRKHEKSFEKSFYNSLFFANGLVRFALEPSIERANYHNFTDFLPKNNKSKLEPVSKTMIFFKEIAQTSKKVSDVTIEGVKRYKSQHPKYKGDSEELSAAFFAMSGKQDLNGYLLIVNKFNTPYVIRSTKTLDGIAIEPVQIARLVPTEYIKNMPGDGVTLENVQLNKDGFIDILPYSITRIKIMAVPEKEI